MIKNDFPIFKNLPELVYLDNAATSQKPQVVIDAVKQFYEWNNANIHRGIYDLSQEATGLFEKTREKVAQFIGVSSEKEIVFTNSTAESINFVAYGWARKFLNEGDIIVLSEMEHHSNIVPWQRLRDEIGVEIIFLPIDDEGRLNYSLSVARDDKIDPKGIKLIALTHASNVLGTINPIAEIVSYFRENGSEAKVLVDAAQSIAHLPIDVQKLHADFIVFSSHKMLGPSGVGVLWAKKELLEVMDPLLVGSHMIKKVTKDQATWADLPDKFEPGTRNLEGVIGFGAAIDYLQEIGMEHIQQWDNTLTSYALQQLQEIPGLILHGPKTAENRLGIFSFSLDNIHPHDVAEILNRSQIAVRSGHHCAQPLMQCLGITGTTRASFYLYNTKEDIDKLIDGIEKVKKVFML